MSRTFADKSCRDPRPSQLSGRIDQSSTIPPDLTLIIPAYNEQHRLPKTLWGVRSFLDDWNLDYRVLVADDGSLDRTSELTELFGPRFSTLSLPRQQGKGAAVRAGMLSASGSVLAFTDADLPFDLEALRIGYQQIRAGACDVVFGARDLDNSRDLAPRKVSRKVASAAFRWVANRLISREITDTQCGLKLFSRSAARSIFSRLTIPGFAFDAEVVYLTQKLRLRYSRVPVTLVNEHSSSLSLARHAWPMLRDLIALRWNDLGRSVNSEIHEFSVTPEQQFLALPERPAA